MWLQLVDNISVNVKGESYNFALYDQSDENCGYINLTTFAITHHLTIPEAVEMLVKEGIHISTNQTMLFFKNKEHAKDFADRVTDRANNWMKYAEEARKKRESAVS